MPTDFNSGADAADTAGAKRNNAVGMAVVMEPDRQSALRRYTIQSYLRFTASTSAI